MVRAVLSPSEQEMAVLDEQSLFVTKESELAEVQMCVLNCILKEALKGNLKENVKLAVHAAIERLRKQLCQLSLPPRLTIFSAPLAPPLITLAPQGVLSLESPGLLYPI